MVARDPPATVLIVEDDEGIAELERLRLEEAGHRVLHAATADEARRLLHDPGADLILLDYRLPGGRDGLEVYAELQAAGFDGPVILVTGFSDEATVIRALRAGVRDFVTKSAEYLDYLPEAVARALRQVGTERRLAESEARLANIIGTATDAVIVTDAANRIMLFNTAAEAMFRTPAAEALGRSLALFIPPEVGPRDAGGSFTGQLRAGTRGVRAGGEEFPLEASVSSHAVGGKRFRTAVIRDVTERTRAEAELERERQFLKALLESLQAGIAACGPDGTLTLFNRAARDIIGRPEAPLPPDRWSEYYNIYRPDGLTPARTEDHPLYRAYRGESVRDAELTIFPRHGRPRTIIANAQPIRGDDGATLGAVVAFQDVTEKKKAEQALRESEARFRMLADSVPMLVWLAGPDGRCTYFNRAWLDFTGKTLEQELGDGWAEGVHPDDREACLKTYYASLRSHQPFTMEYRLRRADSEDRWVLDTGVPRFTEDGSFAGFIGSGLDITERRRAEERVREQALLLDKAADAILSRDLSERITYWNQGAERLYGWPAVEALGADADRLLYRELTPALAEAKRVVKEVGEWSGELTKMTRDCRAVVVMSRWTLLRDEAGRPRGVFVIDTDVTERNRLEAQLRQAQRLEAIGALAGGVAHDFNNLLTVINGYAEMVLDAGRLGPDDRELVRQIHRAGDRAAALTRQLLAFSRKQVLAPRVLDLNALLNETEKMLRRLIGADVALAVSLDPDLWPVKADPGQVEQVVMNLVVNARDAMPAGGRLTIETRNVELDDGYAFRHLGARPGPHVLLAVSDTGTGMTEEVKARVFEPFYTTKEAGKGTGLGLATVLGVVQQSGGHVEVYSEPGRGTAFKVYLPRLTGAGASAALPAAASPVPRGAETVLLIEDDDGIRALARLALQSFGYVVIAAADGEEGVAIGLAAERPLDLLITDLVMPKLSGREAAERLRPAHPGMKVLFISGYTDDAVVRHGVLQEGVAFLHKPFTPTALARKVREVLDGG
jgi:two-component system cell cycle sensor histidine kinase/response regulator CckA